MTRSTYPIDASTPAVVLKFDPNVMHHGGLGVIRSLGRMGVPVYGVHGGPWAPAARSRYLTGRFSWRPNPADADRVLAGLQRLAGRIGQRSVLFTTDDAGAIFLAEYGRDLRRWFLFPDPPADLPRRLAGKHSLHEVCREFGIPSPRTVAPSSLTAAREFASAAGYPLIAKLTTPWAKGSGLRSTSVVASQQELDHAYETCARSGDRLLLQEFIPGGHVIAATGYRINLERLGFLPDVMLSSLRTVGGSAAVGRDYQASIPGLYFIGPSVAPSMGPVMRFVFGAELAATTVGRHLAASPGRRSSPAMS